MPGGRALEADPGATGAEVEDAQPDGHVIEPVLAVVLQLQRGAAGDGDASAGDGHHFEAEGLPRNGLDVIGEFRIGRVSSHSRGAQAAGGGRTKLVVTVRKIRGAVLSTRANGTATITATTVMMIQRCLRRMRRYSRSGSPEATGSMFPGGRLRQENGSATSVTGLRRSIAFFGSIESLSYSPQKSLALIVRWLGTARTGEGIGPGMTPNRRPCRGWPGTHARS